MEVFIYLAPLALVAAVLCPGSNGAPINFLGDITHDLPAGNLKNLPGPGLPVDKLPVGNLPVKNLPVHGLPVHGLSVDNLPVGSLPLGNLPGGSLPVGSLPVGGLPVGSLPIGGLPVGGLPVGGLPVSSLPVGGLPVGGLSLDSLPGGPLPVGNPKDLLKKKPQEWVSGKLDGWGPGKIVDTFQRGVRLGQDSDVSGNNEYRYGGRNRGRYGPNRDRVEGSIVSGLSQGYGGDWDEWGTKQVRGGGRPRNYNDEWDNDSRHDGRHDGRYQDVDGIVSGVSQGYGRSSKY